MSRPRFTPPTTRRAFLKGASASAGAAAALGLLPRSVLGAGEELRVAVVGVGGRGTGLFGELAKRREELKVRLVGVCDVYPRRVERARGIFACEGYGDYRRLLDRKDLDALVVATPDHWHGKISVDAMDAGKHVYCEKPMTHTVAQAIEVRNAVRRHGGKRVFQVGANACGEGGYWKAGEAIRAGKIGKVTWAQGSYNRNARTCLFNDHQRIDPDAGPAESGERKIDWDQWLGHEFGLAPKIPWTPEHYFRFRKYWPYSGGVATDLLYHKLAPLLIALVGPDGQYPASVTGSGGLYIEKDGRDIPDTFFLNADYPGEFSVSLVSALTNDTQVPERIYGKHGTMDVEGDPWLRANGPYEEEFKAKNEGKSDLRIPHGAGSDLLKSFVDAIRGTETVRCNAELGCAALVAIQLAVDSYRQRRTMAWDAKKEQAVACG